MTQPIARPRIVDTMLVNVDAPALDGPVQGQWHGEARWLASMAEGTVAFRSDDLMRYERTVHVRGNGVRGVRVVTVTVTRHSNHLALWTPRVRRSLTC